MPLIKSILVPVDFTPVAANAFAFALRLADKYPARIDLLYCMPTALSSPGMDRILVARAGELKAEATDDMDAFRQRGIDAVINELTGIPEVCSFIEAGDLDPIVKQRIEAGRVDLVVMGTRGREKPLANLVGTNTSYLIEEATVPVLIIPDEADYRLPARLCYATDLEHLDPFRITEVLGLFEPFEPLVDFVHVAPDNRDHAGYSLDLLREAIDRPEIHDRLIFTRLTGPDEVEELLRYAGTSGADVVVMNRPHRGWLERLWKRSKTREALLKTEIPLLILHAAELAVPAGPTGTEPGKNML